MQASKRLTNGGSYLLSTAGVGMQHTALAEAVVT